MTFLSFPNKLIFKFLKYTKIEFKQCTRQYTTLILYIPITSKLKLNKTKKF